MKVGWHKMNLKLNFEFVPDGCWKQNLRTLLPKELWEFLRADAKNKSNNKCAICGKTTNRLEAHEKWSYDVDKGVQKLEDIIAVCKDCHSVLHINRTYLKGDAIKAEDHFMKVNDCSYAEFRKAMGEANDKHKELNKVSEWVLDLSFLKRYVND